MLHAIVDPRRVVVRVAGILDRVEIPYIITGGFAVSVWGRPRATFDIDIVVELVEPKVESLAKALRAVYKAGYLDEVFAKEAIRRQGEFNFIDPFTGLKIDFWVAPKDEFSILKLKRGIAKKIGGRMVRFISPEDLILTKLIWYTMGESARQLEDVESIVKISGGRLDKAYIKKWAKHLEVGDLLKSVWSS